MIAEALLSFSHAYAIDVKELDTHIDRAQARGRLQSLSVPVEIPPQNEFDIAGSSVIGLGAERGRYRWESNVAVTLKGQPQRAQALAASWQGPERRLGKSTLVVTLALTFADLTSDAVIALAKSYENTTWNKKLPKPGADLTVTVDGAACPSLWSALRQYAADVVPSLSDESSTPFAFRISELRGASEMDPRNTSATADETKQLYGILTGDEGWRYVPLGRAREITVTGWGSRDFLWVSALGDSAVLLNDKPKQYQDAQNSFFQNWLGRDVPYFSTKFTVPGLDHGVLYAVEGVARLAVQLDDLTRDLQAKRDAGAAFGSSSAPDGERAPLMQRLRTAIKRIIHKRRLPLFSVTLAELLTGQMTWRRLRLLACVESIEKNRIAELVSMYTMLEKRMGLTDRVEILKENLSTLDTERNELATARRWGLGATLAVIGVLIALAHVF